MLLGEIRCREDSGQFLKYLASVCSCRALEETFAPSRKTTSLMVACVIIFGSSFLPTADFLLLTTVFLPLTPARF